MTTRAFALMLGIIFLAIGGLGFVPALVTPAPASAPSMAFTANYGYLFGLLPVNYFVNLGHMAMGAWGIAASRSAGSSHGYARTMAVISGALAVVGMVPAINTMFGLAPFFGNAVWLHAIVAVVAAFFGWLVPRRSIFARDDVALRWR